MNLFRKPFVMLVTVVLAGMLAYANSLTAPFQFDDDAYIVQNPIIRSFHYFSSPSDVSRLPEASPAAVPSALRYAFMTRVVGYFTFAVNYHLHGLDVTGYHIVNLALHIFNGIFVYLILRAIFRSPYFRQRRAVEEYIPAEPIAGFAALLFVSHPIQTQAVTYLSQRFALLAAFFYLLSFLLYLRFSHSAPGFTKKAAYAVSLASAVIAMLAKEFAVTLPIMLALYDMSFLQGGKGERMKRLAPFCVTLAIIPVLVFIQQGTIHDLDSTMRTITAADASQISRSHYLLTQFRVVVLYLKLLFLPVAQNVDHDIPVYTSLFQPAVLLSFALLLVLFAAAVRLYIYSGRNRQQHPELRLAGFGILWFFITLSVESSVIPLGELAAEYRLYLPSAGLIAAVVSLGRFGAKNISADSRVRPVLHGLSVLLVMTLVLATSHRNTVWSSETGLWEDAARKSPGRVRPHQNLGLYYSMQGRLEDAERELIAALKLAPGNIELHNNLGVLYKQQGRFADALREYNIVVSLSPDDAIAYYNIGNVYLAQDMTAEAVRAYLSAVRLAPDYDEGHRNLGIAYYRSAEFNAAANAFSRALQLNPQNADVRRYWEESLRRASAAAMNTGKRHRETGQIRMGAKGP